MNHIDYSSWSTWWTCPAKWFEVYVNKRVRRWPEGQRDDALAVGGLVHAGLETWQNTRQPLIPREIVERINPTPEAMMACEEMVLGYAMTYPDENWPLIHTEQPLTWPLMDGIMGLAKVDAYFYVPQATTLANGPEGMEMQLSPGWWVHEYKTKDPSIPLNRFIAKWQMNMQVNFQMLALQYEIERRAAWGVGVDGMTNPQNPYTPETVQGVLVNVIEKPKIYVPKRKCKTCGAQSEMASWQALEKGLYGCPFCRGEQKLAKPTGESQPARFYRIIVERNAEQLKDAQTQIQQTAKMMIEMETKGLKGHPWNQEKCVDSIFGECVYLSNHLYGISTIDDLQMTEAEDYRGV